MGGCFVGQLLLCAFLEARLCWLSVCLCCVCGIELHLRFAWNSAGKW